MPRPIDAGERTLLGGAAVSHHLKCELQNASGTWIDLSAWVTRVTLSESIDQPVASAAVTFQAQHGALSLHPLRTDSALNVDDAASYAPLVFGGRRLRISVATGTPDASAPTYPWHVVFEGIVDEPRAGENGDTLTVTARDLGALLLDRMIEIERFYGSEDGVDLEVVMAQILADNVTGLPISFTIATPGGSPNWALRERKQARVSVFEALKTLAQQIGWDVRFRWNGDTPEFQLYEPNRAKTVPDWTLPPDEYLSVNELAFADRDIRNVIRIRFRDRNAGGAEREVTVKDDASIAIYGRRFMEIAEDAASNIDTLTEATAMANAALSDLATPFVDQSVVTFDLWFAELGDLVAFPANSVHYNEDQAFAIVSVHRTWENGAGRLTIQTRGKPAGAFRDWIRKFGRGPDGSQLPAPFIGVPIGEESEGGGLDPARPESGDGMLWLEAGFDPNTQYIDFYVEERRNQPVPVPEVSEITRAWRLYRPPGEFQRHSRDISLEGLIRMPRGTYHFAGVRKPPKAGRDWRTFVGLATRPRFWKRVRVIPYNWAGVAGPEAIFDAVQAVDVAAIADGVVTAVTPEIGDQEITVHVDVGNIDPNHASYLCLMRNGLVTVPLFIGFGGNRRWTIVERGLDTSKSYTLEAFVWTRGVTGTHVVAQTSGDPGTAPPTPGSGAIAWVDPTPDLVMLNDVPHVRAMYVHNAASFATKVILQRSVDGAAPWLDVATRHTTQQAGTFYYPVTVPAWFRFRVANADDSTDAFTSERQFTHGTAPTPPADVLRFVNGSPKLNAAGDAVRLEYQCSVASADHVVLRRSLDTVTWSDVDASSNLAGAFEYGADLTAAYFQLRAEDAADALLALSDVVFWNGVSAPVPDAPPVILAGFPDVVDVAGTPTIRVGYASDISWFARMRLQASGDGVSGWATVQTETDPNGVFLYAASLVPQWFRVRAENANDTQRLHSGAVFFPGVGPTGGGADTTAPEFTLHVQQISGTPQLVVTWTCTNVDAVRVTVEQSADGVSGWAEVNDSAAVASGRWTGGDPLEEAYYRTRAWDANDLSIATSVVHYWAGQLFQA